MERRNFLSLCVGFLTTAIISLVPGSLRATPPKSASPSSALIRLFRHRHQGLDMCAATDRASSTELVIFEEGGQIAFGGDEVRWEDVIPGEHIVAMSLDGDSQVDLLEEWHVGAAGYLGRIDGVDRIQVGTMAGFLECSGTVCPHTLALELYDHAADTTYLHHPRLGLVFPPERNQVTRIIVGPCQLGR
jgi:hypothetical protein